MRLSSNGTVMPCSKFHHKIRNRNCKTAEKTAQIKFCIFESFCKNPSQELVLELKDRHQSIQREKIRRKQWIQHSKSQLHILLFLQKKW